MNSSNVKKLLIKKRGHKKIDPITDKVYEVLRNLFDSNKTTFKNKLFQDYTNKMMYIDANNKFICVYCFYLEYLPNFKEEI